MKRKLLLIMPNFFDYPQAICEELEKMGYEVDCFDDRPSTNGMVKAIMLKSLKLIAIKSWLVFILTSQGIRKFINARKWCICSKIAKMVP